VRVVSLLPAATDTVAVLGLAGSLVGRTHECDWPASVAAVPVVTSTSLPDGLSSREISVAVGADRAHGGSSLYALDGAALAALAPDVVLTQELCEVCAVSYTRVAEAVRVADSGTRLVSLEPTTLPEVLATVTTVGELLGVPDRAGEVVADLHARLAAVRASVAGRRVRRVIMLEWLDPAWPVGHWVPEQIAAAGGADLLGTAGAHTTPVEWSAVVEAQPEVLLLAPCGFTPERTRAELPGLAALAAPGLAGAEVWVLDGPAYWNRPGPRVVRGVEVLARVLHGVEVGEPLNGEEAVRVR